MGDNKGRILLSDVTTQEGEYLFISLVDQVELGEDASKATWVNVLRPGEYRHSRYGKLAITAEKLGRMVENFKAKVLGVDIAADYAHKTDVAKGGEAAGWIKDLRYSASKGLEALVQWTEDAWNALKAGKWRYISADYSDVWTDPLGKKHNDVLHGIAITNSPWMKNLEAINLEEADDEHIFRDIPKEERDKAEGWEFAGKNRSFPILKPSDVRAAISSLGRAGSDNYDIDTLKRNIKRIAKRKGGAFWEAIPDDWKSSELEEVEVDIKKLAEKLGLDLSDVPEEEQEAKVFAELDRVKAEADKPAPTPDKPEDEKQRKFAEDYPEEFERMQRLEAEAKESETKTKLEEWHQLGMPPVVDDDAKGIRLSLDVDERGKFDQFISKLLGAGLVKTKEEGSGNENDDSVELEVQIENAVDAKLAEDASLSYPDALKLVFEEHPDWKKEYGKDMPRIGTKE